MSEFMYLVFSAYVVFFLFDLARSWQQYSNHDKPTKPWVSFFYDDHKWSIGTCVVFSLIGWAFVV